MVIQTKEKNLADIEQLSRALSQKSFFSFGEPNLLFWVTGEFSKKDVSNF